MSDRNQYLSDEEKRKADDKARKKALVREQLEAASKKVKKGFLTPERKKKLRELLKEMCFKEMQILHAKKVEDRRNIITNRIGKKKPTDGLDEDALQQICREYHDRIRKLEHIKYDLEYEVRQKDYIVNELSIEVNNLRGKFVKPALKKVSKYDQNLERMAKVAAKAESDFKRANLKRVQSLKYAIGDDKQARPDWALKKDQVKTETEEYDVED